ncbi:hypothetical protein FGIG_08539 [Fasciola gigantica]|uniref:Uncharacterized protein n=1 Tax=Fasciola gigantica TaxID=46835 RepID=A0A504YQ20_FASGI|nr:hypothetical protein FGIG_08539 [Fasciola gigantica]
MGLRLAGRRTDDTPAPNAYTLPNPAKRSEVRSAPNYTMAGRNDAKHVGVKQESWASRLHSGVTESLLGGQSQTTRSTPLKAQKQGCDGCKIHEGCCNMSISFFAV